MSAAAPILLGRFRLGDEIGRGAMGTVHAGTFAGAELPVAIKVIHAGAAGDETFRSSFRDEVRAVAALNHPAIVMVFDQGVVDAEAAARSGGRLAAGSPYLVMEHVPFGSLQSVGNVELGHVAAPSWPWLRAVLLALLDALAHAHARGVIHRDIKPGNVLLASPMTATGAAAIKLTDFGIAHRLDESLAPSADAAVKQATAGTPHYMAPEQVVGALHQLGPWTDLYAVGCLTYRLAAGRPPFWEPSIRAEETLLRHQLVDVPPLRSLIPVPAGLDAWTRRLLAKLPSQRFRVAADAAAALLALPSEAPSELRVGAFTPASAAAPQDREDIASEATVSWPQAGSGAPMRASISVAPPPLARHVTDAPPRPALVFPATWRAAEAPRRSSALAGAGLALFALRPVPFVGRDAERDALWAAVGAVHASRTPHLTVLRGPAGVGKTRLADWLATRAREVGAATVLTAHYAATPGSADGLGAMVARAMRTAGFPRREAAAITTEAVTALGGGADDAAALLEITHPRGGGMVADGDDTLPRVRFATARERHRALTRYIALLARERPVIVHVDDAQWAPDALAFAADLLASGAAALCVLGISDDAIRERPLARETVAALAAHPSASTVAIAALDDAHHAELVRGLLGLSSGLAADVVSRTRGNPLFAVQLVGDWVQRGILEGADEGFVLAQGADAALPDDIHAIWLRRIRLAVRGSLPALAAVERGAALGPVVSADEWASAVRRSGLPLPSEIGPALELHGLIRRDGPAWAFCHGMLVESLARNARDEGRWEDHHRACAAILDAADPVAPGTKERVAGHLEAAGELEAALAPALAAAWERHESSDYAMALALLDRRDGWIAKLALPEADPRRAWGSLRRAIVLCRIAKVREAEPFVDEAVAFARAHGHEDLLAEALFARAKYMQMAGRVAESIAVFEEARARFEALRDRRGVARCDEGLGELFQYSSRIAEARPWFEAAMAGYTACGDRAAYAICRLALANLLMLTETGDASAAVAHLVEAERALAAIGNRIGVARAAMFLGHAERIVARRYPEAEVQYRRAEALYDALGSEDVAIARANIGMVHVMSGDFARATVFLEEVHASFEAGARAGYLVFSNVFLLPCRAAARDWAAFDAHCAAVEASLARTGFADGDIELAARLAEGLARAAGESARAARIGAVARAQREALGLRQPA